MRKSGKPGLRGPSAKSAKRNIGGTGADSNAIALPAMGREHTVRVATILRPTQQDRFSDNKSGKNVADAAAV